MLLSLLIESTAHKDHTGETARRYSWEIVKRLKANRHEIEPLLASMTHVCAAVEVRQISSWTQRIEMMPDHFHFANNTVVYREFVGGGVLMLAECTLLHPVVMAMGKVENQRTIHNIMFFAKANASNGSYEVRVIPPIGTLEQTATTIFGNSFFPMIAQVQLNVQKPLPEVAVEKKPWWKRIF